MPSHAESCNSCTSLFASACSRSDFVTCQNIHTMTMASIHVFSEVVLGGSFIAWDPVAIVHQPQTIPAHNWITQSSENHPHPLHNKINATIGTAQRHSLKSFQMRRCITHTRIVQPVSDMFHSATRAIGRWQSSHLPAAASPDCRTRRSNSGRPRAA